MDISSKELKKFAIATEDQHRKVFGEQPEINLVGACKIKDGVIVHSSFEQKRFILKYLKSKEKSTFFIPASGSGSRMFQFLFDFLEEPNEENRSKTEKFLNAIQSFAFFELLPYDLKEKVRDYDVNLDEFVAYLLKEEGLGLGGIPKGLIPFHRSRSFVLNAFQEQLIQGLHLNEGDPSFHFTIKGVFQDRIQAALNSVLHLTGRKAKIDMSEQDPLTDSVAFDVDGNPVLLENGNYLRRPSGHGALLKNLNAIDAPVVFIKNIDNVQHESQSSNAVENFRYLGGLLQCLKEDLLEVLNSSNKKEQFQLLNEQYHLMHKNFDLDNCSDEELTALLLRPIRVCGMVRNEGQPGGGPFWVEENGVISKQIVEKAQIKMKGEQYRLMVQSQYFNPVIMAISPRNCKGEKLDLMEFADTNKYFIVDKKFEGKQIKFMESPGLWNGSMANWLTVFVEVPSSTFTPVKNVLDLLANSHQEKID